MLLHTDVPTRAQVDRLMDAARPGSVSVYLPTDPVSSGEPERVRFENDADDALRRAREQGLPRDEAAALEDLLADVADDGELWSFLARSLAVFATAESVAVLRLPNRLSAQVRVGDRFHLGPLLRTLTFPHVAYVLALGQNSVRVVEVLPDAPPFPVTLADLPRDLADAVNRPSVRGRAPNRRLQGSEGRKVRLGQYARRVDQALRPLRDDRVPLVLAAAEPLASIFRAETAYPLVAPATVPAPEDTSDAALAALARLVLDELYAARLRDVHALVDARRGAGRAVTDLAEVARAATYGMVDTLLVDIDANVPGTIDDGGALTLAAGSGPDVVDEVVRRVWRAGGRVLAVRGDEVPGGGTQAAVLRYPLLSSARWPE